ncbi:hypothetical protein [Paenochrobactrum glaciei]|uniref:Uncharacterized protein n=1 Tax=Paenochrobactrum glaciei TaxID=486407 RepID=A0ABN1FYU3_9HYPH
MKIKQTLKEYKYAVFSIGFAASIPLIIFLSSFMGERCQAPESGAFPAVRCGHYFTNWIYDFQSLITGCTALLAAWITITTMNKNTRELMEAPQQQLFSLIDFSAKRILAYDLAIREPIQGYKTTDNGTIEILPYLPVLLAETVYWTNCLSEYLDEVIKHDLSIYIGSTISSDADDIKKTLVILKNLKNQDSILGQRRFDRRKNCNYIHEQMDILLDALDRLEKVTLTNIADFLERFPKRKVVF